MWLDCVLIPDVLLLFICCEIPWRSDFVLLFPYNVEDHPCAPVNWVASKLIDLNERISNSTMKIQALPRDIPTVPPDLATSVGATGDVSAAATGGMGVAGLATTTGDMGIVGLA